MSSELNDVSKDKRFKPGQSGNPKGRPKGRSKPAEDYEAFLGETIKVATRNGKTRLKTRAQVVYEKLFSLTLEGNSAAVRASVRTMKIDIKAAARAAAKDAVAKYKEQRAREADVSSFELRRRLDRLIKQAEENDPDKSQS